MDNAKKIIRELMEKEKINQSEIGRMIGEDRRNLNQQLNKRSDLKVARFEKILKVLGYRIEIVRNSAKKVSKEYMNALINNEISWQGNYYSEIDEGKYYAVSKEKGTENYEAKTFGSEEECFEWFIFLRESTR